MPIEHGIHAEVHRSHIERAQFRRGPQRRRETFIHRHALAATGRDVHYRTCGLPDARQELHEYGGIGRRATILRIASVKMQHSRACLGGFNRLRRNLLGRDGQKAAHRWRMNRAGYRTADDNLGHVTASLGPTADASLVVRSDPYVSRRTLLGQGRSDFILYECEDMKSRDRSSTRLLVVSHKILHIRTKEWI